MKIALLLLAAVGAGFAYKAASAAPPAKGPSPPGPGPAPGPALPQLTCEQAMGALTPEWRGAIQNALALDPSVRQGALLALANQLDVAAESTPVTSQYNVLHTAAQCVRAAAMTGALPTGAPVPPSPTPPGPKDASGASKPLVDEHGVPSSWDGGPALQGQQSNPAYQWVFLVKDPKANSALNLAFMVFSNAATGAADSGTVLARAAELVAANPTEHATNRALGSVGTPGTAAHGWADLRAGDRVHFPPSWNAWIDQLGYPKGTLAPWPAPLLKGP